ncbi:hypothetical protein T261_06660 [Streptomyces lydicus]|nr:hypothetical protein T261_06660 [Streptomyces lydicus]
MRTRSCSRGRGSGRDNTPEGTGGTGELRRQTTRVTQRAAWPTSR